MVDNPRPTFTGLAFPSQYYNQLVACARIIMDRGMRMAPNKHRREQVQGKYKTARVTTRVRTTGAGTTG